VLAPDEVPDDVAFDQIWSNPPTHVGKAELHALLERWLPRLAPDGVAWLVINRHLGGDSLHAWLTSLGWDVDRVGSQRGFRVLRYGGKSTEDRSPAGEDARVGYVDVAGAGFVLPDGRELFSDVSFRVGEGAKVALVGPNGAGKTTLLRMVAGDIPTPVGAIARSGGLV
jgi:ABC-type multidrug transport system fused ATPase/permease subunit